MIERGSNSVVTIPCGGFVERSMPLVAGLQDPPTWLCDRVTTYIESVAATTGHGEPFREGRHQETSSGVETTVWALAALHQVGARAVIAGMRDRILASLNSAFNAELELYEPTSNQVDDGVGRWRLHNDAVVRLGFELLGAQARKFPHGLDRLQDFPWAPRGEGLLDVWLEQVWAGDTRAAAKETFQYLWLYTGLAGIRTVQQLDMPSRRVLAFMESHRDSSSGFIGMGSGTDLGWAMRGHRNLALNLLWPLGIGELRLPRMIDATLACQRSDGLFHDGGMCANMDAIHLLAEYGHRTSHQQPVVRQAARRCVRAVLARLAAADGGFHFELGDVTEPVSPNSRTTNGLAFALFTLRYLQAMDHEARDDLGRVLQGC